MEFRLHPSREPDMAQLWMCKGIFSYLRACSLCCESDGSVVTVDSPCWVQLLQISEIPHAPLGQGEPVQDVIIAGTYFELLCASRGLGTVMMTFPLSVLKLMPEINAMLRIPEDHYTGMIIGFGYPQLPYARGTQRTVEQSRIHRLCFREMTGTQAERE